MSWLSDYLSYTKRQESPTIFHFWNAIGTVAGAVNRKVWFPRVVDGIEHYKIFPGQLMIVLVAGSGKLRKSTSMKLPKKLLTDAGIKILDGVTSPEKLLSMLGGPGAGHNKPGVITIMAPELSVFLSRQNYATSLVNVLNDLADAPDKKDFPTQGRGDITVLNACVTLIGATTPVDLAESIPPSALQRGFSSRIIFVYAKSTDRIESLSETKPDLIKIALANQRRDLLLAAVKQFATLSGPFDFTDEARAWFDTWYRHHVTAVDEEESEGWSARRHDHMLRVGMVLQICKNQQLMLDLDCLQRADEALKMVEDTLPEVFASIGLHSTTSQALDRILAVFKKNNGRADNFLLGEKCIRYFPDFAALNKAMLSLQTYGWVRKVSFDPVSGRQEFELIPPHLRNGAPAQTQSSQTPGRTAGNAPPKASTMKP